MSVYDTLNKLKGVKRSGDGWIAFCPTHNDKHHSLSIKECDGGRVLLFCHAGCSYKQITDALVVECAPRSIKTIYDYCAADGSLLYQAVRFEPKGFSQRRPDGKGGFIYKLNGTPRVLYRLPEIIAAPKESIVFIPEGEKDCDRLASFGLLATTNVGGAGKWRDDYSEYLHGQHVVILPDNDEPGRKHSAQIAKSLLGIAASVRLLELPNLSEKGDVSDWLDAGGTIERLRELVEAAPVWTEGKAGSALSIARMIDVAAEKVRWLWYPYIALGKLTLLEGDPGLGKSWLTCAMAAGVSCGRGLPGAGIYEAGNVLMLSAEDGLADTLRPRLDAVGADVSRVFALAEPLTFDMAGLVKLEAATIEYKPLLVIIDPLFAFTGAKADIHRANECRAISAPLAAIAERQGCAIVALRHLGKSRGGGHALNAGIGSIDFTAAARSVLLVGVEPDEPNKRAIVQIKNNLAPHGPAVGFKLEDGQFYWTGESSLTASRILSVASEDERSTVEEAAYFLRHTLEDGPVPTNEIKREARKAGISDATLRRAKDRLGVRSGKRGGHFGTNEQCWVWILPGAEDAQESAKGAQEKEIEHLQTNSTNKNSYSSNLAEDAQLSDFEHLQKRGLPDDIVIPPEMPDEEYKRQFEEFRR